MPFIFRSYVDNYGINSAQTNQIMTTACVIVKLQPEQFNKSIKRNTHYLFTVMNHQRISTLPFTKNIHNFFQGLSNPGFRSVKVQTETFLKKDSRDFKNSFQFRFL